MKNILSPEAMADWCDAKGNEEFNYNDLNNCAGCQYFRDFLGLPVMKFGGCSWEDYDGRKHRLPIKMAMALSGSPKTFSALARRLREAAS